MDELVRALRYFVFRDVVGGGVVIASCLYRFGRLPTQDLPQDSFNLFRVVATAPIHSPGRVGRFLYWLFTRQQWPAADTFDLYLGQRPLREGKPPGARGAGALDLGSGGRWKEAEVAGAAGGARYGGGALAVRPEKGRYVAYTQMVDSGGKAADVCGPSFSRTSK